MTNLNGYRLGLQAGSSNYKSLNDACGMDEGFSKLLDEELLAYKSLRSVEIKKSRDALDRRFADREQLLAAAEAFLIAHVVPKLEALGAKFGHASQPTISGRGMWESFCFCNVGEPGEPGYYVCVSIKVEDDGWEWVVSAESTQGNCKSSGLELNEHGSDVPSQLGATIARELVECYKAMK